MDTLTLQKEFTANFGIDLCRSIIRTMWNYQGVIKNEISENAFELKNICVKQNFGATYPQHVTIILDKRSDNSTIITIQSSPFSAVNNNESIWKIKMEELIGVLWTELIQTLEDKVNEADNLYSKQTKELPITKLSKKSKKIIFISVAIIAIIILLVVFIPLVKDNKANGNNGIEIIEEQLVTNPLYAIEGNYLYPIIVIKVKNTSSVNKKVSFEANFYADGNLLGSDQADYVTLTPGDETYLKAQSDNGYLAWKTYEYSYKITKWWIFDQ